MMTSKRWILGFAVGLLLVLGAKRTWAQQDGGGNSERPNIVWIIAEDLSPFHLGAYGNAVARTPHIDRLAAEGRRYTNAFALNGACAPNRSSLVTGLYPTSYGAHHMRTMRCQSGVEDSDLQRPEKSLSRSFRTPMRNLFDAGTASYRRDSESSSE